MKLTIKTRYTLPNLDVTLYEKLPDLLLLAYIIFVYVWNYTVGFSNAVKYSIHFLVPVLFLPLAIFKFRCMLATSFEKNFLLFFAFCCLSIFFSIDRASSLERCITLFAFFMILTSINIYVTKQNKLEWLIFCLCCGGIALALYNFYFYGVAGYLSSMIQGHRVGGDIMNLNIIGKFCSFSAIICFWYATYKNKIFYYAPMILCTFVSLGSASRKSLGALVLGCCMLYLFKDNVRRILENFTRILLLLGVFVIILQLPIFERTATRFISFISVFDDSGSQSVDNSTYLRSVLIKRGMEDFLQSPLMGVGINNAHYLGLEYTGYNFYMHNNYVELLVSIGIIGTLIYYMLLIYPLIKLFRPALRQDEMAILLEVFLVLALILDFGQVTYTNIDDYFLILAAHIKVRQLEGGTKLVGDRNFS